MNIIFGEESLKYVESKYTCLLVDRFKVGDGNVIQAYCVLDFLPVENMSTLTQDIEDHNTLIFMYRDQQWSACLEMIDRLYGKWDEGLNEFYDILRSRIDKYKNLPYDETWSDIIGKNETST